MDSEKISTASAPADHQEKNYCGHWTFWGFPGSSVSKESTCNAGGPKFDSWVGKIPWRRERLLQYSGLENSMDCSPWGHKELDTTERLLLHFTSLPYFLFLLHFLFIFFILLLSMSYLSALSLSQIWPNKVLKHYICCTSLKKVFRRDFYI